MKEFAGLDCSICYEKFTSTIRSNSYPVVLTQCGHSYCKGCSVRLHGKSCLLGCNIVIDFRKCVPNFGLISVIDEISQFLSKFGPQTRSKFFGLKTIFCHNSVFIERQFNEILGDEAFSTNKRSMRFTVICRLK